MSVIEEPRDPELRRGAIGYSNVSFEDAIGRASVKSRDEGLETDTAMIVAQIGFTIGPNPPFGEYWAIVVQGPRPGHSG